MVALLGIWAALGHGHWFLRLLIVTPILLAPLLIPAYELVIQHSLAVMLIVAGIWVYRVQRPWHLRYSLATISLVMTMFALIGSVLVNAPRFDLNQWLEFIGIATLIASLSFVCLWAVFGKGHWWLRMRILCYCGFFLALVAHAVQATLYAYPAAMTGQDWRMYFAHSYSWEWLVWWWKYHVIGAMLATAILIALLLLARGTDWFAHELPDSETTKRAVNSASRLAFVAVLIVIAALPVYVFYRLLTPTSFPPVVLPNPNGYDDFIAAGKMINDDIHSHIVAVDTLTISQLESIVENLSEAMRHVELGLTRECANPNPYRPYGGEYESDQQSLVNVFAALTLCVNRSKRTGNMSNLVQDSLRLDRFLHAGSRGNGTESLFPRQIHGGSIRICLGKLAPSEYRLMAHELSELDALRESHCLRVARQRIIDQHVGWSAHLQQLLFDWSGQDQYEQSDFELDDHADFRMAITELAIHAFLGDKRHLPNSLDGLVPEYLPRIPDDPFSNGPLKYIVENDRYKLYSFGWDRDDDGGRSYDIPATVEGDHVVTGPMPPPLRQQAIEHLHSAWSFCSEFVKRLSNDGQKPSSGSLHHGRQLPVAEE